MVKNPLAKAGDMGLIPGLGKSSGGRNGSSIQYSCLLNPMDQRSLAGYSPWGQKESDTTEHAHVSTGLLLADVGLGPARKADPSGEKMKCRWVDGQKAFA